MKNFQEGERKVCDLLLMILAVFVIIETVKPGATVLIIQETIEISQANQPILGQVIRVSRDILLRLVQQIRQLI